MDWLSAERIREGLKTRFVGQNLVVYKTIGSTNEVLKDMARLGAPEGTLLVAEEQTQGKGRWGRTWVAPAASSLLFSLLFRPGCAARDAAQLTMLTGLGVLDGIRQATGLDVYTKWPNDLMVGNRKVGGILAELDTTGELLDWMVVGVGLNVNFDPSQIPEIAATATSLFRELGCQVSRVDLLGSILVAVEERYLRWQRGETFHAEWRARCDTLGRLVQVQTPSGVQVGQAEAVDAEGALILRQADGSLARFLIGEVSLARDVPFSLPRRREKGEIERGG